LGDLIIFPLEERKMRRVILWSMRWSWVNATSGRDNDLWAIRFKM